MDTTMTEADFLSPSEQEEVEAALAGQALRTDAEQTEFEDEMAEAYDEYTRCGCSDPLCPCVKSPMTFPEFVAINN